MNFRNTMETFFGALEHRLSCQYSDCCNEGYNGSFESYLDDRMPEIMDTIIYCPARPIANQTLFDKNKEVEQGFDSWYGYKYNNYSIFTKADMLQAWRAAEETYNV